MLETRNDGVKFSTSSLQGISDEYRSLKEQYTSAQASVAEEVMNIAAGYAEPMQTFSDIVAQLDVLVSFAVVSMTAPIPYTRPTITPRGLYMSQDLFVKSCDKYVLGGCLVKC